MQLCSYFSLQKICMVLFFAMYVKKLGGSYADFAIVLSVTGFVLSVIQSYVGYLSDKIGAGKLVLIGGGISAIGMLLTGVIYHSFLILPLYLLMSIGMGILVPSVFSLVSCMKTQDGESFIPTYRSIQGVGVIVGNATLNRLPRRMRHRGDFSVSVAKEYWNQGIGGQLLREIIAFPKENSFEIIDLQVRSDNYSAIYLYKKHGFRRICTYPSFFKIGDQYIDFDYMSLLLKHSS